MAFADKLIQYAPRLPGFRALRPRRTQLVSVGLAKTGTHSLAAMGRGYRSLHEAEIARHVGLYLDWAEGRLDDAATIEALRERDRRLWLEFDVSHLHGVFLPLLATALPEARFVLTLRDPWDWLDSVFNQRLADARAPHWVRLREHVYGRHGLAHPPQEAALAARGLAPLDVYLGRWAQRVALAREHLPAERLLVLRTDRLRTEAPRLAAFLGVPLESLHVERSHAFQSDSRHGVLAELDPAHVRERILDCGRGLLADYFPERL